MMSYTAAKSGLHHCTAQQGETRVRESGDLTSRRSHSSYQSIFETIDSV